MEIYSKIKLPQMRQMLVFSLQDLSNPLYQKEKWISKKYHHGFWNNLELNLEFLYDDIVVYERPEDAIGYVLVNWEENEILRPLYKALDDVCEKIGENQPDSSYMDSPLWDRVVEAAAAALKVFLKNEEEAKKTNPKAWQGEDDWGREPECNH